MYMYQYIYIHICSLSLYIYIYIEREREREREREWVRERASERERARCIDVQLIYAQLIYEQHFPENYFACLEWFSAFTILCHPHATLSLYLNTPLSLCNCNCLFVFMQFTVKCLISQVRRWTGKAKERKQEAFWAACAWIQRIWSCDSLSSVWGWFARWRQTAVLSLEGVALTKLKTFMALTKPCHIISVELKNSTAACIHRHY